MIGLIHQCHTNTIRGLEFSAHRNKQVSAAQRFNMLVKSWVGTNVPHWPHSKDRLKTKLTNVRGMPLHKMTK